MPGRRLLTVACLAAALATIPLAGKAEAAGPKNLFGIVGASAPYPTAAEFQRMARGGASTVRVGFFWGNVEPTPGARNWTVLDAAVANATASGISLLPVLYGTPQWATSLQTSPPIYTPESRAAWSTFLTDLAARYGSNGTFWALHPELVPMPLRFYQVWNEVNLRYYWGGKPNARRYADFLRLTSSALKAGDPTAKIVGAGLIPFKSVGAGSVAGPRYLQRLFKIKGVRGLLDAVAVHPYAKSPGVAVKAIEETRKTLNAIGGRRLPLWVTEFGWSTGGEGWSSSPVKATEAQQASRIVSTYRLMSKQAKRLRLQRAYVFTFSDAAGGIHWNSQMGLFSSGGQPKPAWFAFVRRAGGTP